MSLRKNYQTFAGDAIGTSESFLAELDDPTVDSVCCHRQALQDMKGAAERLRDLTEGEGELSEVCLVSAEFLVECIGQSCEEIRAALKIRPEEVN